jgi:carbon monoxide dehydrogenase subunit G
MEFSGTSVIEGASPASTWLILSDPVAIAEVVPGCKFIAPADEVGDPTSYTPPTAATFPEASPEVVEARAFEPGVEYVALLSVGVGSIKPTFEASITIEERDYPRMRASADGQGGDSAFETTSSMEMSETASGVEIDWHADVDISGRLAQMGGSVLDPVADRVVNRFFDQMEERMQRVEEAAS